MKNIINFFYCLLILAIISACSSTTNEIEIEIEDDLPTEQNQQESNEAGSPENDESKQNENEQVEEKTENETDDLETDKVVIEPTYKINENNWKIEPISADNSKVVLFTIDDAPDQYGLKMAQYLKKEGINAIFFVNGHFIDSPEEKEELKEIHRLGFMIGNHTWNHKNLKKLSEEEQYEEIISLSKEIEQITGEKPKFFRAPFGANTDYAKQLVKEHGMVLMNWTYGYDFVKEYMTKETLSEIMVNTPLLTDGANLLMHDREWTFAALPDIITGLKEKGYEFVDPKKIQTP